MKLVSFILLLFSFFLFRSSELRANTFDVFLAPQSYENHIQHKNYLKKDISQINSWNNLQVKNITKLKVKNISFTGSYLKSIDVIAKYVYLTITDYCKFYHNYKLQFSSINSQIYNRELIQSNNKLPIYIPTIIAAIQLQNRKSFLSTTGSLLFSKFVFLHTVFARADSIKITNLLPDKINPDSFS